MSSSQVWGVWQGDTFGPTLWAVFASKEAAEGHAAERRERTEETIEVRAMDVLTEPPASTTVWQATCETERGRQVIFLSSRTIWASDSDWEEIIQPPTVNKQTGRVLADGLDRDAVIQAVLDGTGKTDT